MVALFRPFLLCPEMSPRLYTECELKSVWWELIKQATSPLMSVNVISLSVYIFFFFLERHFSFSVPPLEEVNRLGPRISNTSPSYRNGRRGRKLRFFVKVALGDDCFAYSLHDGRGSKSQKFCYAVNKSVLTPVRPAGQVRKEEQDLAILITEFVFKGVVDLGLLGASGE